MGYWGNIEGGCGWLEEDRAVSAEIPVSTRPAVESIYSFFTEDTQKATCSYRCKNLKKKKRSHDLRS